MGTIFTILFFASIVLLVFQNPTEMLPAFMTGGAKAVTLSLELCGILCVWLGIMEILSKAGITQKLAQCIRPVIRKLFGKTNEKAEEYIAANLAANMLGLGNAATPMGIKAMEAMDNGSGVASKAMILLMVINATSVQLLPTTEMGLLTAAGCDNAGIIIIPTFFATIISTTSGILLVQFFSKIFPRKQKETKQISSR